MPYSKQIPAEATASSNVIPTEAASANLKNCDLSRGRAEGPFLIGVNLLDDASKTYLACLQDRMSEGEGWMYVYILANPSGLLYVGVTNDLVTRLHEHRIKLNPGFTQQKNCSKLVYFELHTGPDEAIDREKQIKGWRREKKERLVRSLNPPWIDLEPFLPHPAPCDD